MLAQQFALRELPDLIPLDQETLKQVVDYACTLPTKDDVINHFLGFIGESPEALDFVSKFNELLFDRPAKAAQSTTVKRAAVSGARPNSEQSSRLQSTEGAQSRATPSAQGNAAGPQSSKTSAGHTVSSLLPASKPAKTAKSEKTSVAEIDQILKRLEIADAGTSCNCRGTRHPLFAIAPNCLSCGKIICVKQGLTCSFCGQELIPAEQRDAIVAILEHEKQEINKPKESSTPKTKGKKYMIAKGQGNLWEEQDKLFAKLEAEAAARDASREDISAEERQAQERLKTLLHFQETSAERTKIIDQASDFSMTESVWGSAYEKALQLKQQQRKLVAQESKQKARTGRGKKILDITLKNGKVIYNEIDAIEGEEEEEEELELKEKIRNEARAQDLAKQQVVWDFEKDAKKWSRPVYNGGGGEKSGYSRVQLEAE